MRTLPACTATLLALIAVRGAAAVADSPESAATGVRMLEEVIVTAARRPAPLQSVPAALTVLTADDLRTREILLARDVAATAPNVAWLATDGAAVGNLYVRGVGSSSIHGNQLGNVALLADDVPLGTPLFADVALLDLERVEILRGPQNAGPGAPASGGAIRFISRRPEPGAAASGSARLRLGSSERFDADFAATVPLGEHTALRLAGARLALGDYVENRMLGRDEGGYERELLRLQWRHVDADAFEALASLHGSRYDGTTIRYKQIGLGTPGRPGRGDCALNLENAFPGNGCVDQTGFADTPAFDENFSGNPARHDRRTDGAALRLEWTLPQLVITALSAYDAGVLHRSEDTDAGPSFLFTSFQDTEASQWSQALQATSHDDGPVGWQAGVLARGERGRYLSLRRNPNTALSAALSPGAAIPEAGTSASILYGDLDQRRRHLSAFVALDLELAARSTLLLEARGVRETLDGELVSGIWTDAPPAFAPGQFIGRRDAQQLTAASPAVPNVPFALACPAPFALTRCHSLAAFDDRWDDWGGRIALQQRFAEGALGWAALARGVKGPGVSPIARDALAGRAGRVVGGEQVTAYELGLKLEWPRPALRMNVAAFWNDWRDLQSFQTETIPGFGTATVLASVPRARTLGAELEVDWLPAPAWRLRAAAGVLEGEVVDPGELRDVARGAVLPGASPLTFNALVSREVRLARGRLVAQAESSWAGRRRFALAGGSRLEEPGYWLLDASLRWQFGAAERYELALWGENLGGTRYCVRRATIGGLGTGDAIACQPNEGIAFYGVTLQARFD